MFQCGFQEIPTGTLSQLKDWKRQTDKRTPNYANLERKKQMINVLNLQESSMISKNRQESRAVLIST